MIFDMAATQNNRLELFTNGNQHEYNTGGWVLATSGIGSSYWEIGETLTVYAVGGTVSTVDIRSKSTIDLTNIKTLHVDADVNGSLTNGNVQIRIIKGSDITSFELIDKKLPYDFDISDITGECSISIYARCTTSGAFTRGIVTKMWAV